MSRLTKKVENNYTLKEPEFIYEITNKLGQFEDFEDDLSKLENRSIEILFKIIKQGGIFIKIGKHIYFTNSISWVTNKKAKYNKNWALTREELL